MRPPESFVAQPIRSLQTMIRVIAQDDPRQPPLVPDGIYGNQTATAVSTFQRNNGLPVTGVADQDTWEAIVSAYEPALVRISQAEPIYILLQPGQVIRRGERNPNIYLVQAILMVLSEAYASISQPSQSGILDEATSLSLAAFQEMTSLPQTGELDKVTWKHLALHYPLATNINKN